MHKYYNDKFHWPKILSTIPEQGEIYHMDYSENLSQAYKYEPQSSHFNKQQYSLHCTVKHVDDKETPYVYMYHLSNVMKHNYPFTSTVIDKLLEDHNNNSFQVRQLLHAI